MPRTRTPTPTPTLEHSVRWDQEAVAILDRRTFPFERTWLRCTTVDEVAAAIAGMVTQSSGPYFATLGGLVLAARAPARLADLERAAALLVATRPTNDGIARAAAAVLAAARAAEAAGEPLPAAVACAAEDADRSYRRRSAALGRHAAALLPPGATVLTHCWADLYLVELVRAARAAGNDLRFVCTETRPYLQGARLTAETLAEMGVDTTVVTDGTGPALLAAGEVDALVTAGDRVTMDGHVVNKVGTLGLAVAAHAFGVPFHALVQAPDRGAPTAADVPIEERDGDEVLSTLGRRTASPRVRGRYPAFDVTPPRFVTTVVTDRGPFAPDRLAAYFDPPEGRP